MRIKPGLASTLVLLSAIPSFAAPSHLICVSQGPAAQQLRIDATEQGHAAVVLTGPNGETKWKGLPNLTQASALGKLYHYDLSSNAGQTAELWVSYHHLFESPQFCGRAGCPEPEPEPSPEPTYHGPHRLDPLADHGISAQIKMQEEELLLDCDEAAQ